MDFKKMLIEMAEAQAYKMQEEAMKQIESDEFADMLAHGNEIAPMQGGAYQKFLILKASSATTDTHFWIF